MKPFPISHVIYSAEMQSCFRSGALPTSVNAVSGRQAHLVRRQNGHTERLRL
jgi:hypothetical protein